MRIAFEHSGLGDFVDGLRSADPTYQDIPGFCKAASLDEVRGHDHVLTPGRYVGAAAVEDDGTPFPERLAALKAKLDEQLAEGEELGGVDSGEAGRGRRQWISGRRIRSNPFWRASSPFVVASFSQGLTNPTVALSCE